MNREFSWTGDKPDGSSLKICEDVKPGYQIYVQIHQEGNDGWCTNYILIEEEPGSGEMVKYSMEPSDPIFCTDGDNSDCTGLTCCSNGDWYHLARF